MPEKKSDLDNEVYFIIKNVTGDGNCFWRALSHLYNGLGDRIINVQL